ncbi:MAG: hypothetical protein QGG48_12240 [Desulfatiglandales bacterium]|nr:hypothetical protein [Desulfatiglandales bacterium]
MPIYYTSMPILYKYREGVIYYCIYACFEKSPGRSNAKIHIFGSRGIVWETRLAFLRHMWGYFLNDGENQMEIMRVLKDFYLGLAGAY